MAKTTKDELEFSIEEHICVLSENPTNQWTKELNRVSWNGKDAKYDIRAWNPDHTKMGKGITLTDEEMEILLSVEL